MGLNRVIIFVISLPRTLMEFLDNCKNANGKQSFSNVKLQKTNAMKEDESPAEMIPLLKMITIKKELFDNLLLFAQDDFVVHQTD